jgi:hypothetical protein
MFAGGDTVPSISFKDAPVGASITGKVTEAPVLVQSRDFDTGYPAFWPDNNPKMSVVTKIVLASGEERGLWAAKPSAMFAAIAEAQKTAGALIAVGGTLTITFTGEKPNATNPRLNAQKLYSVVYVPPNAFDTPPVAATAGVGQWGAQSATAPPPAWAAPAAAAPVAQAWQQPSAAQPAGPPLVVVPNPQVAAVAWTPEQIAAAHAAGIPLPGVTS